LKISDWIIVFILIIIPFVMITNIKKSNTRYLMDKNIQLDKILGSAVSDGAAKLYERGDSSRIVLNKENAIETFYFSLKNNLKYTTDEYQMKLLKTYTPAIIILEHDGCCLCSFEVNTDNNGEKHQAQIIRPKKYYMYETPDFICNFTISDTIIIYNKKTGERIEGKREDLIQESMPRFLESKIEFEALRYRVMTKVVETEMLKGINKHNLMAKNNSISYEFYLPTIDDEDWERTIESIGMIAFFQGMPLNIGDSVYNGYALAGAQIFKQEGYYLDYEKGLSYYHRAGCTKLKNQELRYANPEECAKEGAFPCDICKP